MSRFRLYFETKELQLENPFTIARGTKRTVPNVFVRLEARGIAGYGEAGPNARYNEDADKVIRFLDSLPDDFFDAIKTPPELADKLGEIGRRFQAETFLKPVQSARAAIEMAWLDWWAKEQGKPLWRLWEAPSNTGPVTSFTIGLDEPDVMQQKVEAAAGYPILKVKLGTGRDREIIRAIREVTGKPLRVDANEGWKTLAEARAAIDFLAGQNIEMVEQPMPAGRLDDMAELKTYSPIPLCADESFEGNEDLEAIAYAFDCINIKLMKIGSMVKARQVIQEARRHGLNIMIGCMIESSLANTAGAILALRADYADLDGHLLIKDDPFRGLALDENKHIVLNDLPGLGVEERRTEAGGGRPE